MTPLQADTGNFIIRDFQIKLETLNISITNKCNLNCMHCGLEAGPLYDHQIKVSDLNNAVAQFVKMGGRYLTISGGEPFTRPDLSDILCNAIGLGLFVNIETNATLIDTEIINNLLNHKDNIHFCISLDGFSEKTHDWFRKRKGAFTQVMKSINMLADNGFRYSVSTVLNKLNQDEITAMTEYFVFDRKIYHSVVPFISNTGRGASNESRLVALSNAEVMNFVHNCYYPLYLKAKSQDLEKLMFIDLPKALLPGEIYVFSACGWGFRMAGINPNGQFGICHRFKKNSVLAVKGSAISNDFNLFDYWFNHRLFHELRKIDAYTLQGVCSNCRYNELCRGHCRITAYNTYGDTYAPYPVCQTWYDEGLFPESSLINKAIDCTYRQDVPI